MRSSQWSKKEQRTTRQGRKGNKRTRRQGKHRRSREKEGRRDIGGGQGTECVCVCYAWVCFVDMMAKGSRSAAFSLKASSKGRQVHVVPNEQIIKMSVRWSPRRDQRPDWQNVLQWRLGHQAVVLFKSLDVVHEQLDVNGARRSPQAAERGNQFLNLDLIPEMRAQEAEDFNDIPA